ncbi:hypothetical protein M0805_000976 [Coniferiporia weirii]|nr:hypothetical protein M0805_000976 [Coniferiporia weirii]
MNSPTLPASARSLYRSLVREANKLPYGYLRAFFRIKFRDDVASAVRVRADTVQLSGAKLKNLKTELRKLKAANVGDRAAFIRTLNLAYGRARKLKRELIEPFLSTTASRPPPIIPGVERSRPPVYSSELAALLTSPYSRTTKAIKYVHIETPPAIPLRADPASEEARLLGPFSKRREVNIRWRYFTKESRKVLPPLQVSIRHVNDTEQDRRIGESNRKEDLRELGLLHGGFQNSGLLGILEGMAGAMMRPPKTRRERNCLGNVNREDPGNSPNGASATAALPTRFLRRCHQELLGKIPVLTYCRREHGGHQINKRAQTGVQFEVSLSKRAVSPNLRYSTARLAEIDKSNLAWVRRAQGIVEQRKTLKK